MKIIKLVLVLGFFVSSILWGQNKNRFSLQTGLMHCFFDGSPVMNIKYPSKAIKPFNGVLINSVGSSFQRNFSAKSSISIDFMHFFEGYSKTFQELKKNQVYERAFNTATLNYNRLVNLNDRLNFIYGGGLNYRFGQEVIIVNYGSFSSFGYESLNEVVKRSDFGINLLCGIEYTPIRRLTFYSKIDLLGFVYMVDKEAHEKLRDTYDMENYPNRLDLSLKLGIGFNF